MKRVLLVAALFACPCGTYPRTHWNHGDSDASRDCFRECLKTFGGNFVSTQETPREACFSLCPEADPKVVCE